jgi:predicted Ser/Thr protein kinase
LETLAGQFPQLDNFEHLGRGGMGVVYKARQRQLNRLVAVKILPPSVGDDPAFAERFTREAQALAQLNHPNIVQVYDFGRTEEFFYFVMEYVDGVNLRALIRDGKLKPEEALKIVPQICEALQFAHDEGIVHRDIKPENILIDKKGRVKIADFGLAKLLGRAPEELSLTGTGQLMGTLGYMAPEQLQQAHTVDHRADIYSLGVVFYEMLTSQLPIGRFEPPSKKVQVDVRLDQVVLRALENEPDRRYQHASEIKSDVESVTSKPQVVLGAQLAASGATESGARLLLDETDRAARRYQHFFEIGGFISIQFGLIIAVIVFAVNMPALLPIPIALGASGVGALVAAGRIRQQWEIDYLGHSVRFENSVYTSGRLMIDGKTMASGGIGFRTELSARIPNGPGAGDRIVVKTHAGFLSFRCQLFVEPKASTPGIGIKPGTENAETASLRSQTGLKAVFEQKNHEDSSNASDFAKIHRRVSWPATALLIAGILGFAGLFVATLFAIVMLNKSTNVPGGRVVVLNDRDWMLFLGLVAFGLIRSFLLTFGGLRMKQLASYRLAVAGSLVALMPNSSAFLIVWSLIKAGVLWQ